MSNDYATSTIIPQSLLDRLAPDYRTFVESQPPAVRLPLHTLRWSSHQHVFSLRALDMLWCRDLYLPKEDRTKPDASPLLQGNKQVFEGLAPAFIVVAEFDILKSEGEMYAEKLRMRGVPVTLKEYKGLTHAGVAADRVCEVARAARSDQITALKGVFSK